MTKKKNPILTEDDEFCSITLEFKYTVNEDEETFGIEEYEIEIVRQCINDQEDVIGKLHAFKFLRQITGNIRFALDYDSATAPFMEMFTADGDFTDEVQECASVEGYFEDFLVLDRLEILPPFRGHGYAGRVFELIARTIGFNTVVAMKAFPLQLEKGNEEKGFYGKEWQEKMQLSRLPKNDRTATRRLTQYYEKFGFKKLPINPKENFLVRSYVY